MRSKYVEERYKPWFIFGESADKKVVDINDGDRDVLTSVPREQAEKIIEEHNALVEVIVELALGWDRADSDSFSLHWYGAR